MARPESPPGAEHAAEQAQAHIPDTLPPPPPQDVTLPGAATGHMPEVALGNIPEWLFSSEPAAAAAPPHKEVTLPGVVTDHMPEVAVDHLPDWLPLA